jgi:thiol-disulfide isomerase/thioredoxin
MIRRGVLSDTLTRRAPAAALVMVLGLLGAAGGAFGQVADGIVGFTPIGDYMLAIDGVDEESAQIFGAQHARALVVLSSELPSPVLIDLSTAQVSGLHLMKVARRANGSLDLLPEPVAGSHGTFGVSGDQIQFDVEGHAVVVKPKPVLTGLRRGEELVEYDPGYGVKRDSYQVTPALVDQLRQQTDDVRVRIYFGTWCPACSEMVPRAMRIDDELQGSRIRFEYYGLPRSIVDDAEARAMNISGVPTGIVYRGDREVGRISGNKWRSPEQALLEILRGG